MNGRSSPCHSACRSLCKAFKGLKEQGYVSVTLAQISDWLKKHGERYVHPEHPCFYILRQVIGTAEIENLPVESSILALEGPMKTVSVFEEMFASSSAGRDVVYTIVYISLYTTVYIIFYPNVHAIRTHTHTF